MNSGRLIVRLTNLFEIAVAYAAAVKIDPGVRELLIVPYGSQLKTCWAACPSQQQRRP